jgi:hypothetical protein
MRQLVRVVRKELTAKTKAVSKPLRRIRIEACRLDNPSSLQALLDTGKTDVRTHNCLEKPS